MCIYITVICASKNKHGGNNWGTHEPIFSLGHFTAEAAPARHLDTSKEEKKKKKKHAALLPWPRSMLSGILLLGLPKAHCECDVRCVRNELSTR